MIGFLKKHLLAITILISVLLHLPFLDLPPKSIHVWRQSHTLAVARNFYTEGMNIFKTRVDNRFEGNGITGSHFPLFEFILAGVYHLTGETFLVQRAYCLILHIFGIIGIFLLVKFLFENDFMAVLASWSYAWSPLLFYYGISALPDNIALPFSIWGLFFSMIWVKKMEKKDNALWMPMLAGFLFFTLAGLTKIQYLAAGFFVFAFLVKNRGKFSRLQLLVFGLFGAICSSICLAWYFIAVQKIKESGLADFGIEFKPETDPYEALAILKFNLISDLPEMLLSFGGTAFFIIGIYFLFKKRKFSKPLAFPFLAWAVILVAYHLIELSQMRQHDYYMMPYLPILCILVAFGANSIFYSRLRYLAYTLLLSQPIFASIRIIPARFMGKIPETESAFYESESLKKLRNMVPDDKLCVVGPDNSKCIYFYFLKKKGFGFNGEDLSAERLMNYRLRGARYLYTSDKNAFIEKTFSDQFEKKIGEVGHFSVFELKP